MRSRIDPARQSRNQTNREGAKIAKEDAKKTKIQINPFASVFAPFAVEFLCNLRRFRPVVVRIQTNLHQCSKAIAFSIRADSCGFVQIRDPHFSRGQIETGLVFVVRIVLVRMLVRLALFLPVLFLLVVNWIDLLRTLDGVLESIAR